MLSAGDFIYWATATFFTSGALYWMKQPFIRSLKQTWSWFNVLFLKSIFRLYPRLKMSFEHKIFCRNLFLNACFCWDSRLFLLEIDQKHKFAGIIGHGARTGSFLAFLFKVFRQHAILHNAPGAVRAHSGKGRDYCYIIGPGPISCLLRQVTLPLFCLHVRLFSSSIFNSVDFWSSMSCLY